MPISGSNLVAIASGSLTVGVLSFLSLIRASSLARTRVARLEYQVRLLELDKNELETLLNRERLTHSDTIQAKRRLVHAVKRFFQETEQDHKSWFAWSARYPATRSQTQRCVDLYNDVAKEINIKTITTHEES